MDNYELRKQAIHESVVEQFCPPPLPASNLNDIASALEKLNISDTQIATIKSYLTDVSGYDQIQNGFGQFVSVLATARNLDKESIDNLNEQVSQKRKL